MLWNSDINLWWTFTRSIWNVDFLYSVTGLLVQLPWHFLSRVAIKTWNSSELSGTAAPSHTSDFVSRMDLDVKCSILRGNHCCLFSFFFSFQRKVYFTNWLKLFEMFLWMFVAIKLGGLSRIYLGWKQEAVVPALFRVTQLPYQRGRWSKASCFWNLEEQG